MGTLLLDLKQSLRWLSHRPGFTAVAVVVLGLGMAVALLGFGAVDAVLLEPPAVDDPDGLVAIYAHPGGSPGEQPLRRSELLGLERDSTFLDRVVTYAYAPMAVEEAGSARLVLGCRVSADFFAVLGVEPTRGRFFDDDSWSRDEVVLGYSSWRRRWGSDPDVVGSTLRLGGRTMRVVGVAASDFEGPTRGVAPEVWMPVEPAAADDEDDPSRGWWALGRLTDGVSIRQTAIEIDTLSRQWLADPGAPAGAARLSVVPFASVRILPGIDARLGTASAVLLGCVLLVLMVAVFNVSNLVLARGLARRAELATRRALGASTLALVRQATVENLVLATLGAVFALGLSWAVRGLLATVDNPLPVDLRLDFGLDGRGLAFALVLVLGAAVALALGQGRSLWRNEALAVRDGGLGPGHGKWRRQSALVVGQVGFSAVLLVLAGLMVRSAVEAHRVDLGFEPQGVVVATLAPGLGAPGAESDGATERFFDRLRERVEALAEVESVGLASHLPLTIEYRLERLTDDEGRNADPESWPVVDTVLVDSGYFSTLRTPHLAGRLFDDRDRPGSPAVVVVNQALAKRLWPGQDPLGRRLHFAEAGSARVVGMVADSKTRTLGETPRPVLYQALDQVRGNAGGGELDVETGSETLVARVHGDPAASLLAIRGIAREIDPGVPLARLETFEETLELALFLPRASALFLVLLGLLAWVLSVGGLYGVMAFDVAGRAREIGLRRALGARRPQVAWQMARRGVGTAALGLAGGLLLAWVAGRAVASWLFGVSPDDPWIFATVAALLWGVAILASWLPAHRASGHDPWRCLRSD